MKGFYESVIAVLKQHGFSFSCQGKGSHEWWSDGSIKVQVPFNCHSRFTANAIMKQAGISQRF